MKQRKVGDRLVGPIGLGTQNLSVAGRPDRETAVATIHAALDSGISLLDTSDAYTTEADGQGHNELLIAEALASYSGDSSHVLVATKGGLIFRDEGPWIRDGSPAHLIDAAGASRHRLGVDTIDLYHFHRPDPDRDFSASVDALAYLVANGTVRRVGLSNVTVAQIEIAQSVLGEHLVSIENQYSPLARVDEAELRYADSRGLAYLLWAPLGGVGQAAVLGEAARAFRSVAEELGVSPQRVALAWELTVSGTTIPIPGATTPEQAIDCAAAVDLVLSAEQLARLTAP
ncbi:oxidoreductase [Microbacterium faecale]|uniref:Oxidoreductase n=1 Tax=Microbacterium faecale TaxID=1804630 RepID=A0A916Y1V9_9MICO|nr:aldo/keto reductase [Microbacterium faecale]GGD26748.1 oxidoreductase [Microbacterium faecale]